MEQKLDEVIKDPSRIFNADETGFQTCPSSGKVLAPKGEKNVYSVEQDNSKESITVLFTFSASGKICPPMIVYPYKRLPERLAVKIPPEWGIGRSDKGWMTADVFKSFISEIFYPHLVENKIKLPVILFIDGHKSHISYELSLLCNELQIELIALYPNATRIMQPADVSVFGPMKKMWKKAVREFQSENIGEIVTKISFAGVLKKVVHCINANHIINGFRACGIYPFDENALDYSKCIVKQYPQIVKALYFDEFCKIVGTETIEKFKHIEDISKFSEKYSEYFHMLYQIWQFYYKNDQSNLDTSPLKQNVIQDGSTHVQETLASMPNNASLDFEPQPSTSVQLAESHSLELNPDKTYLHDSETSTSKEISSTVNNQDNTSALINNNKIITSKQHSLKTYLSKALSPKRKGNKQNEKIPFTITGKNFQKLVQSKIEKKIKEDQDREMKKNKRVIEQKLKNEAKEAKKRKIEDNRAVKGKKKSVRENNIICNDKENNQHLNKLNDSIEENEQNITFFNEEANTSPVKHPKTFIDTGEENLKKIKVLSNIRVEPCNVCKRLLKVESNLQCGDCMQYYHKSCLPKKHKEHVPESEDNDMFLCHLCYILSDDSHCSIFSETDDVDTDYLYNLILKEGK